jgi:hypothetical protein
LKRTDVTRYIKKINGVVKDETILTIRLMSLGGKCNVTLLDETVKEGESMLQGVCIDTGSATILEKGKKYFLFSNGVDHYYVSNFSRASAHKGCFHKSLFELIQEDEWPPEPSADNVPVLDSSKIYAAKLVWRNRKLS